MLSDKIKQERVSELRQLLKDHDNLKNLNKDDALLERFLLSTDYDVEQALAKIVLFYDLLQEYPDWFSTKGPLDKKNIIEQNIRAPLGQCDKEGRPIYIAKMANCDINKMTIYDVAEVDDVFLEFFYINDPLVAKKGICTIVDIDNYSWKLLKWCAPHHSKVASKKMQALPFRDYRVHIVNESFVIHAAVKLVFPFLPEYIKKMVFFHFGNWESLYEHIDREVLPTEYGGKIDFDYKKSYEPVYKKNDEIYQNFQKYRNLENSI